MKYVIVVTAAIGLSIPALADNHEVSEETVGKIEAMLADMKCQMDPDDIEMTEAGGYDLDDVICEGGNQFDIELDADLNEVGRRAE